MRIEFQGTGVLVAVATALTIISSELRGQSFGILEQRHVNAIYEQAAERGAERCVVANLDDGSARTFINEELYRAAQQPVRHLYILQGLMRHQQGQVLEREYRMVEAEVARLQGLSRRDRQRLPAGLEEAVTGRYRELHAIFYPDDVQAADPIGMLSDMFSRTVVHAGLASGNGFVQRERAVGSSTFVLTGNFVAGGQSLEWRSPNLGGPDGPIAVLYDACHSPR